jgi:hypothetical protein
MADDGSIEISLQRENTAPFIFFEGVPFVGHAGGVFRLTLVTARGMLSQRDAQTEENPVVVAHLRGNAAALLNLRSGIEKALLLGIPAAGET